MRYTVLLPVLCVFHILCLSAFEVSKKTNSKADISFPKFYRYQVLYLSSCYYSKNLFSNFYRNARINFDNKYGLRFIILKYLYFKHSFYQNSRLRGFFLLCTCVHFLKSVYILLEEILNLILITILMTTLNLYPFNTVLLSHLGNHFSECKMPPTIPRLMMIHINLLCGAESKSLFIVNLGCLLLHTCQLSLSFLWRS